MSNFICLKFLELRYQSLDLFDDLIHLSEFAYAKLVCFIEIKANESANTNGIRSVFAYHIKFITIHSNIRKLKAHNLNIINSFQGSDVLMFHKVIF